MIIGKLGAIETSSGIPAQADRSYLSIAQHMDGTRYRGRISATPPACRPDLLPIDHKRQGRGEVHIPLFYPDNEQEISEMFRVMTRKNDAECQLDDRTKVTTDDIDRSPDEFIPSAQPLKKTLQELASVLACTHRDFLDEHWRDIAEAPEGRPRFQQQLTRTRPMVKSL